MKKLGFTNRNMEDISIRSTLPGNATGIQFHPLAPYVLVGDEEFRVTTAFMRRR
jgi:hypothetical protein